MNSFVPNLQPGLEIGDYVLRHLIAVSGACQTWLGEQVSVHREVEIVCYYGDQATEFLSDVRVKAMVENGIFGLVYEAIQTEDLIAFAAEVLPQRSIAHLVSERHQLTPLEVNHIIKQTANALASLKKRGIAHEDFGPEDIRLGAEGEVRIRNIARAGEMGDDLQSRQDIAEGLRNLLQLGQPGATRMGTLLAYIEGTETQAPIPWAQAVSLAEQVEQQLRISPSLPPRTQPVMTSRKSSSRGIFVAAILFCLLAILVGIFVIRSGSPEFKTDLVLTVPAGRYPRPDGGLVELEAFRLDSAEVTIKEYSAFIIAWAQMGSDERKILLGPNWPSDKVSIRPLDWNTYLPLARSEGTWKGRKMSVDCPVMGVDWWDAFAYAKWRGGHLPTAQEWWAASSSSLAAQNEDSAWGPVGGADEKIFGLVGGVAEWAGNFSRDPAFPINSPSAVVLGGSFVRVSKGALTREWVESPGLRRDDLGFRVAYPVEQ